VTANGFGKRTGFDAYPLHRRGGQGVISIDCSERNGQVIGAVPVNEDDEIMLITDGGTLVRTRVQEISILSRNTQGVKLINVSKRESVIGVERVESMGEDALEEQDHDDPEDA
jgi:DNA gyrase subunit A